MEVLSDRTRRVLANLSIPRNVDEIVTALRPLVVYDNPKDLDAFLKGDLSKQGWVKKVATGEDVDPAKIASSVQGDKDVMPFTDERARIWSTRLGNWEHAHRLRGDQWMLTEEGLAKLHEPVKDDPPMTPRQVQAAVDAEWARTLKGHDQESYNKKWGGEDKPDGPQLYDRLLEQEFLDWYKLVADDCEARWNVRPVAPMAGGASGYSDAYEVSLLDAENQKTALGAVVDPWFLALSILAFTDADTGTTADDGTHKPTYTGYARKSVAGSDMNAASGSGGSVVNANAIIFAACTAGSSVIVAAANCVASTVGVLRKWGDTSGSVTVSTTQTPAQVAAGSYTTSTT